MNGCHRVCDMQYHVIIQFSHFLYTRCTLFSFCATLQQGEGNYLILQENCLWYIVVGVLMQFIPWPFYACNFQLSLHAIVFQRARSQYQLCMAFSYSTAKFGSNCLMNFSHIRGVASLCMTIKTTCTPATSAFFYF